MSRRTSTRSMLVRCSDFQTNDYAGLVGGADLEPSEKNPLLGIRGASRFLDELDAGVKRMIEMVVRDAHRAGRPVGICGQAPSDHHDFAAFLVDLEIDSISLNPDSTLPGTKRLAGASDRPPHD